MTLEGPASFVVALVLTTTAIYVTRGVGRVLAWSFRGPTDDEGGEVIDRTERDL